MIPQSYFEITTQMGCKVNCLKYCPQEKILAQYKGNRVMSFGMFEKFMETIPDGLPIFFSGLSEPFQNQECIDMIEWCHANGHPITIFSTLTGLTPEHAKRLVKIPITKFVWHLPDPYLPCVYLSDDYYCLGDNKICLKRKGKKHEVSHECLGIRNANIPNNTPEYQETRQIIEDHFKVPKEYMDMGVGFKSHLCEGMARHDTPIKKHGRRTCIFLQTPGYQLSPNGDVCFCCMVRGITEKVGNLYEETYSQLAAKHPAMSYRMATDPNSICHICTIGEKYWLMRINEIKEWLLGGRTIMQLLSGGILSGDKNEVLK